MKIVIAPDSFKESLAASDVAAALAAGVLEACPEARIDLCPMADGGEGTVAAMVAATGGTMRTADVFGPLGAPIRAKFGLLGRPGGAGLPGEVGLSAALSAAGDNAPDAADAQVAVIEMSAASGLALVPADKRDPMRTTTFGTGQLILAALDAGVGEVLIGIGGSATCDGGCGCAQALGVTFLDGDGAACVCGLAGGGLADIEAIDLSDRDARLADTSLRVACDVTNPLTGPRGAAAVYGPQKGATPEMVARLDANLAHLERVIRDSLGMDVGALDGAGAAGGLGAGLVAFAGGKLTPGLQLVAEAVGLPRRFRGADLCLTGEGKLDRSSAFGKTAVGVAKLAGEHDVPTICIPGQADDDAPADAFAAVRPLVANGITASEAIRRPAELLKVRAFEAVRNFLK